MFRSESTSISNYEYSAKKYLANASIATEQTEVGIVTKPLNGYVVFMLDYIDFCLDTDTETEYLDVIIDYSIIEA